MSLPIPHDCRLGITCNHVYTCSFRHTRPKAHERDGLNLGAGAMDQLLSDRKRT